MARVKCKQELFGSSVLMLLDPGLHGTRNHMTTAMGGGCLCPMKNLAVSSPALHSKISPLQPAGIVGRRQLSEKSWILNKNRGILMDMA